MSFSDYFSKQARKPAGLFGRFFASLVFEKGNAEMNAFVQQTVAMGKDEHGLEIGFGTGLLMKVMADRLDGGCMEGVDFSEPMVALARKKNRMHIKAGKVKIHGGDFDEMPFDDNRFDIVFTVNTVYFWRRPVQVIAKIHRILKPGGRLVIGFHAKDEMEKLSLNRDVFRYYAPADMVKLLSAGEGLKDVTVVSRAGKEMICYCALGTKADSGLP